MNKICCAEFSFLSNQIIFMVFDDITLLSTGYCAVGEVLNHQPSPSNPVADLEGAQQVRTP